MAVGLISQMDTSLHRELVNRKKKSPYHQSNPHRFAMYCIMLLQNFATFSTGGKNGKHKKTYIDIHRKGPRKRKVFFQALPKLSPFPQFVQLGPLFGNAKNTEYSHIFRLQLQIACKYATI